MSSIESTRSNFFPQSKEAHTTKSNRLNKAFLERNTTKRTAELEQIAQRDAKVNIPESVKDFGRIKKAVDMAPEVDNTDKIASLKARIQAGSYNVDYDALADKILTSEF